jgi:hypothetical protein
MTADVAEVKFCKEQGTATTRRHRRAETKRSETYEKNKLKKKKSSPSVTQKCDRARLPLPHNITLPQNQTTV